MSGALSWGLAALLNGLAGFSLAVFGGGGSLLAVPILVYVAQIPARPAIGMSLAIVGVTSLLAAGLHHRSGNVLLRVTLVFGGAGMIGAFWGAHLTKLVSEHTLLAIFSALMATIGLVMYRFDRHSPSASAQSTPSMRLLLKT